MLEDNFGRRFHYLRLSITDVCNFKCTYCLPDGYQNEESKHFLTLPEIKKVAATFAKLGTSKVRITGGEPALRKDLPDIISAINNTSGIDKVAITTNGYKLSTQIDDWIAAGLDALNVSIDSLNPHMFRQITGHNKLDEIMKGIERGFTLGLSQIKVNAVLMKQYNANEFSGFLDWIKETPVTLRFIELMQTGDNIEFFQKNHVSGSLLQQSLEQQGWQRVEREIHAGPAIEYSHPNYAGRVGLIMPYSPNFCKSCNRLRVTARGKLHLCLFSENGLDIRSFLQENSDDSLAEYLKEKLADKKVSHYLHDGMVGATKHLAMLGG